MTDIMVCEADEEEIILMLDDVGVKAQKPHKKVGRESDDAKRLDTTVILVQDKDKGYHYATQGIDKTGKTVIESEFDKAFKFSNGLALIRIGDFKNGKFGYIDNTGKVIITPKFFGAFNFDEWTHLFNKHAKHHLKQFGVAV